jgi:hypothetical protein
MDQRTEAKPDGAQRRGWMRFSVRRLFLAITIACVLGGVTTVVANRIAAENERVDRTNDLLMRVSGLLWEASPVYFSVRAGGRDATSLQSHDGPHRRLYRIGAVHLDIEPSAAKMTPAELGSHLLEYYSEAIGHGIGGAFYSTSEHRLPSGQHISTAILSTQDADLLFVDALIDPTKREAVVRIMVVVASD